MSETYRGLWVVAWRDLLNLVGDRSRLLASLAFPLLFLAIFSGGFSEVVGRLAGGVDLLQFMYPGIIAQTVLTTALFGGVSVVADRETGFLRELLVAPIGRAGIVLGKVAGAAGGALLQVAALLGVAPFVGVPLGVGLVARLVPLVALLAVALAGLGVLIAAFAPSQQGFQLLMQLLVFPLVFLAGVFFPVDRVPRWMEILSKLNPVTYGVDAVRQVFLGAGPAGSGLGVTVLGHTMTLAEEIALIGALGIVLVAGAIWAFGRQE